MPSKLQQKTTLFWILSVIFWLGLFACFLFFGDQQILFALNHHYNFGLDILNAIFSFFGRGDTIAIFFILLLFKQSFRNFTYLKWAACYGITASLINFLLKEYFNDLLSTGEFQSTFRKDDTDISPEELAKREKSREKTKQILDTNIDKIANTFDKVQSDLESNVVDVKELPNKLRRFTK